MRSLDDGKVSTILLMLSLCGRKTFGMYMCGKFVCCVNSNYSYSFCSNIVCNARFETVSQISTEHFPISIQKSLHFELASAHETLPHNWHQILAYSRRGRRCRCRRHWERSYLAWKLLHITQTRCDEHCVKTVGHSTTNVKSFNSASKGNEKKLQSVN